MRNRRQFVDTPLGVRKLRREERATRWFCAGCLLVVIALAACFGRSAEAGERSFLAMASAQPTPSGWVLISNPANDLTDHAVTNAGGQDMYVTKDPFWVPAQQESAPPKSNWLDMSWQKALVISVSVILLILWIRT